MKLFNFFIFNLIVCLINNVYCQKEKPINITKTFYQIEGKNYCLITGNFKNTTNDDFFLWISSTQKTGMDSNETFSIFRKYINSVHGDFSLLNLITESDTTFHIMDIFKTFLKKLSPNEEFNIFIILQMDTINLEKYIDFLKLNVFYIDAKKVSSILDFKIFPFRYFSGKMIVLKSDDL